MNKHYNTVYYYFIIYHIYRSAQPMTTMLHFKLDGDELLKVNHTLLCSMHGAYYVGLFIKTNLYINRP